MAPGVGAAPPEQWLFCPRCGARNPPDATTCHQCGQDLRLVAAAVRARRAAPPPPPRRWRRRAGGLVLVLLLALALIVGFSVQRQRRVVLEHYLNGVWAAEVGRWDVAVAEFEAAGDFRDAPQRRALAEANLNQVQARYAQALAARREGRSWDAAYLLRQVVAALPGNQAAQRYLDEMRAATGPLVLVRRQPGLPPTDASTVVLATADLGAEQILAEGLTEAGGVSFSSDGRWFTYEALDEGALTLRLVETATGTQTSLVRRAQDFRTRWSPGGDYLLYSWQGAATWSLALRHLATASERVLSDDVDFAVGDFSPQGKLFTLWERRSNQWRLRWGETARASPLQTLVERADGIGLVAWSPDEARLAYGYLTSGQWQLRMVSPEGNNPLPVAPEAEESWLLFRPASESYLLWQWREGLGTLTLYQAEEARALLGGAADAWAQWSNDGRWLALARWNGRTWRLDLWPIGVTGLPGEAVPLIEGADDADVSFSPQGHYLLYRTWEAGRWRVAVRDLAQGETHTLLADVLDAHASWAPDGEHVLLWWAEPLAETPDLASERGSLAVAAAASGRRVLLMSPLHAVQGGFARDGSKMVLATQDPDGRTRAWVADPDGSDLLELDRQSYRAYWARAPFAFGPRLPGP